MAGAVRGWASAGRASSIASSTAWARTGRLKASAVLAASAARTVRMKAVGVGMARAKTWAS